MSLKITILPEEVANHIAAGEVIERPASVVKELVENALDAEATQIEIEIGVGGKAYIRVSDDGVGMSQEDARLAFERHATSKISTTADLASITTLGFRGEALPSIASVSKVKLLTRLHEAVIGTRIDIHGGEILNVTESGSAPGTFIEVNELFYKTPARLKFLKSPATELSYINTVILEESLAHPDVGFTVKNNAKEQLHLSGKSDLLQRIAGLFGRDLVREVIEVREQAGNLELRGFIGTPVCHRANRNYQKMFVNTRPVKDKTISHAIQQAYDTLIPKGRYPVAFLFLSLPSELVDVNVHPTKMEIRFVNAPAIHDFIVNVLRKTFSTSLNRYTVSSAPSAVPEEEQFPQHIPDMSPGESHFRQPSRLSSHAPQSSHAPFQQSRSFQAHQDDQGMFSIDVAPEGLPAQYLPPRRMSDEIPALASQSMFPHTTPGMPGGFAAMKPIGQFYETYLLVQAGEDLCIIDQHAAHERIFYEKLQQQIQQAQPEIQQLLFPVPIEFSHREQAVLEEYLEMLNQSGLELEPFGGTTYLLKAVPALLVKADHKKLLYDIVDQLAEPGSSVPIERKFDEIVKLMACHSSVRAHQPLQHAQIVALLQQLDAVQYPFTCPHGRPIIVKVNVHDLEKKFGRT